jgi:hypothetical protein
MIRSWHHILTASIGSALVAVLSVSLAMEGGNESRLTRQRGDDYRRGEALRKELVQQRSALVWEMRKERIIQAVEQLGLALAPPGTPRPVAAEVDANGLAEAPRAVPAVLRRDQARTTAHSQTAISSSDTRRVRGEVARSRREERR